MEKLLTLSLMAIIFGAIITYTTLPTLPAILVAIMTYRLWYLIRTT